MATLVITNLSSELLPLSDPLITLQPAGDVDGRHIVTITRSSVDLPGMTGLMAAMAASKASLSVTYDANELASGLMSPPAAIQAVDMAPVSAATAAAALITLRIPFAALTTGTADDVTVYAANALPFKFRVLDAVAHVSAAIGGATLIVRDEAAGAGTAICTMSGAATGRIVSTFTGNASGVVSQSTAAKGLFVRRSDRAVAGEVVLTCRIES